MNECCKQKRLDVSENFLATIVSMAENTYRSDKKRHDICVEILTLYLVKHPDIAKHLAKQYPQNELFKDLCAVFEALNLESIPAEQRPDFLKALKQARDKSK